MSRTDSPGRLPWAVVNLNRGQLLVMKGCPPDLVDDVLRHTKAQPLQWDEEQTTQAVKEVFGRFGSEWPLLSIDKDGRLICHYGKGEGGSCMFDYAHPHFVEWLDRLLDHIKRHDNLLGFSARASNGAGSGPRSGS